MADKNPLLPTTINTTSTTSRMVLQPIPRWKIVIGVVAVTVLTIAVVTVLWWVGTRGLTGKDLVTARLDALKVGLSIGVGSGGLFALYLAWRRQRSTEADLDNRERTLAHHLQVAADTKAHQERIADATDQDAEARRITDLYTKAVEQLGSDKAPVRMGGLYALERLAQDHPHQRQTIVNVICAYLRMPYTPPPPGQALDPDPDDKALQDHREWAQEREVRLTAQRLLTDHVTPGEDPDEPAETFWANIDLNLTGAALIDFDLRYGSVHHANFEHATFTGRTSFYHTTFTGHVNFSNAAFADHVDALNATFRFTALFDHATFAGDTDFSFATFEYAVFEQVTFTSFADFTQVTFTSRANFTLATFGGDADFLSATFDDRVLFEHATFNGDVDFELATFHDGADFKQATFTAWADFEQVTFNGDVDFEQATFTTPVPDAVKPFFAETTGELKAE